MHRKNLYTLLALTAVILVAGCLGSGGSAPTQVFGGPGIVITDFRSDFTEIDTGEVVTVALDFENRGDFAATSIIGTLIRKGAFTPTGTAISSLPTLDEPLEDVFSSDEFIWDLESPTVTQDRFEDVQARLAYDYKTEGFATVHFVPRELIREQSAGAFTDDRSTSAGPIEVEITSNQPITIRKDDSGYSTGTVTKDVRITTLLHNTWTGRVDDPASATVAGLCNNAALDCVKNVKIELIGNQPCTDANPAGGYIASGVKMLQGEEGRVSHTFQVAVTELTAATSCQVKVTTNYRYRVDSNVIPINVLAIN